MSMDAEEAFAELCALCAERGLDLALVQIDREKDEPVGSMRLTAGVWRERGIGAALVFSAWCLLTHEAQDA